MKSLCAPGSLTAIKDINLKAVNLDGVVKNYQGIPKVNEREVKNDILCRESRHQTLQLQGKILCKDLLLLQN